MTIDTSTIDSLLSRVDMPAQDTTQPLTAAEKRAAEGASKRAYHAARAVDKSVQEATQAAEQAYRAEVESMRAPPLDPTPVEYDPYPQRPADVFVIDGRAERVDEAGEVLCYDCGAAIEGLPHYEQDPEEGREVAKCGRCAYVAPTEQPFEPAPFHKVSAGTFAMVIDPAKFAPTEPAPAVLLASAPNGLHLYAGSPPVAGGELDVTGEARSLRDLEAARAAGFAPAETVYRRGLRVIDLGVENARASRIEHDAKPLVGALCDEVSAKIAAEHREDHEVIGHVIQMDPATGHLAVDEGADYPITEPAFASLVSRLGYGGSGYLGRCPVDLRAENVNRQAVIIERALNREILDHARRDEAQKAAGQGPLKAAAPEPKAIKLRTRMSSKGAREVFAAVSPSYTAFDIDKIAAAVKLAMPSDARASMTFDGYRSQIDVAFHSDIQPQHYVAGEFFKAGLRLRTADDGSGSVRGSATLTQNLCLNLLIIDEQMRELFRVRHIGSVEALAAKIRVGIKAALASVEHFLRAWGYACEEDVVARARALDAECPADPVAALPGLFRGLLAEKRVSLPGRDIEANVLALVAQWETDASGAKLVHEVSRASIVNALTRYAHVELPDLDDPFAADELERDASALLWATGRRSTTPAPLVWMPKGEAAQMIAQA